MRTLAALLVLLSLAAPSQAGSIEDTFRGFIDKLKASGKAVTESSPRGAPEVKRAQLVKRTDTLPLGEKTSVLFVADGCRSCSAAQASLLKRTDRHLEVLNISRSQTAREAFVLTGAKGVPAVLVEGYVMSGYSNKLFDQALIRGMNDKGRAMQGQGS
jgi:hypothetical protein